VKTLVPLKSLGLDSQRVKKLALKLHAHSVHYAHKLVKTRRSLEHSPHLQTNQERSAGSSARNPPDSHLLLFSFLVKGLFFPSGPFSLIDARSFLLLALFFFSFFCLCLLQFCTTNFWLCQEAVLFAAESQADRVTTLSTSCSKINMAASGQMPRAGPACSIRGGRECLSWHSSRNPNTWQQNQSSQTCIMFETLSGGNSVFLSNHASHHIN